MQLMKKQFSVNEAKYSIVLETIALGERDQLSLASDAAQSFLQGPWERNARLDLTHQRQKLKTN